MKKKDRQKKKIGKYFNELSDKMAKKAKCSRSRPRGGCGSAGGGHRGGGLTPTCATWHYFTSMVQNCIFLPFLPFLAILSDNS